MTALFPGLWGHPFLHKNFFSRTNLKRDEKGRKTMDKVVETKKGALSGADMGTYAVFRGVPYAKPPVGKRRWQPPQKMEPWEGVRKADAFAAICPQDMPTPDSAFGALYYKEFYSDPQFLRPMSEDCLYLNIWAPKEKKEEPYPVAFWIHGGAFSGGYGSELEFDGEKFCEKGVILVTVQYRLNVYGFLAHPWLSKESELGISGNYGILDQIAALDWVRENISAFGGDPDRITVFGQSAGSMSAQVLVSSELTRGKIAGAILQSGISCKENILYCPTLSQMEELGEKFVRFAHVSSLEELRFLDAESLREARLKLEAWSFQHLKDHLVLVPNADGYVLSGTVKELWEQGRMHDIPYLVGSTGNDLGMSPEEAANGEPGVLQKEGKRWALKVEEVYGKPTYLYWFTHRLPGDDAGAFHSSEIWYVHGTLKRCWRPMTKEDEDLSERMATYWTNFMKTGDPNGEGVETWSAYRKEAPYVKEFR